ncbi:MAG: hypothetical protein JW987_04685 [Anaerolineaceae bacterium]|nr:hypothetical protein [Anaerolineaceae bacterium]
MADPKKEQFRIFKAELDSLPIQLVPPDPVSSGHNQNRRPLQQGGMKPSEPERQVVHRVIDRIKKI